MKISLVMLLLIGSSLLCFSQKGITKAYTKISSQPKESISAEEWQKAIGELQTIRKDTLSPEFLKALAVTKYLANQSENLSNRTVGLNLLLDFSIGNPRLFGSQTIPFLKAVPRETYDSSAIKKLAHYLSNSTNPSTKEALKIAGYVGGDYLFGVLQANPSIYTTTKQIKWPYALAMARMGDQTWLSYCMEKVKRLEVNAQTIYIIYPDLAYTRQKEAIDYLVTILLNKSYLCDSPNPESTTQIDCGYRIMEILAPVVNDFPFKVGASGDLAVPDYSKALVEIREWFLQKNGNYTINNNI